MLEKQKNIFVKSAMIIMGIIIATLIIGISVIFYQLEHQELTIDKNEDGVYAVTVVDVKNANTIVVRKAYKKGAINDITVKLVGIKAIEDSDNDEVIAKINNLIQNYDILTLSTNQKETKDKTVSGYLWLTGDQKNIKKKNLSLYNLNYLLLQNGIVAYNDSSNTKYAKEFQNIETIAIMNQAGFYKTDKAEDDSSYKYRTITDEEIEAIKDIEQPDGVDVNNLKGTYPTSEDTDSNTENSDSENNETILE